MTYEQAKQSIFAFGSVPDGYFGKRAKVGFAFDKSSGKTLIVADSGYFTAPIPLCISADEALYHLRKHPSARNIKVYKLPELKAPKRTDGKFQACETLPMSY